MVNLRCLPCSRLDAENAQFGHFINDKMLLPRSSPTNRFIREKRKFGRAHITTGETNTKKSRMGVAGLTINQVK